MAWQLMRVQARGQINTPSNHKAQGPKVLKSQRKLLIAYLVVELGVAVHGADVLPQLGEALLGVASPLLALLDRAEV